VALRWGMCSSTCGIYRCVWSFSDTNELSLHDRWNFASKSARQDSYLPYSGDISFRHQFAVMNSQTIKIPWNVTICIQDYGAFGSVILGITSSQVMRRISHWFGLNWWVIL